MANLVLDAKAMQEDFFSGTAMIGIGAAMQGYNFCWLLNNRLAVNFIREPEQNLYLKRKVKGESNDFVFPVYNYLLPDSEYRHTLYKLKAGAESLLPKARQLDYLWLVGTDNSEQDALQIVEDLRKLPEVQLARIMDAAELKDISNLLL